MVLDRDVLTGVERFRLNLARQFPVERVLVFGSRARGTARNESDVDIMIVSSAFEGKSLARRALLLSGAWDLNLPADFVCYTPAEFEHLRGRVSLVSVALEEGTEVRA